MAVHRTKAFGLDYIALYVGKVLGVHVAQIHRQQTVIAQLLDDEQVGKWLGAGGELEVWCWGRVDEQWQCERTPILMPEGWLERWMAKQGIEVEPTDD